MLVCQVLRNAFGNLFYHAVKTKVYVFPRQMGKLCDSTVKGVTHECYISILCICVWAHGIHGIHGIHGRDFILITDHDERNVKVDS